MPDDDREDICGESYDHSYRLFDERDGVRAYLCDECGAETTSEDDKGDATAAAAGAGACDES